MGSVQQAVLEFDEEVRAPWRPRLVVVHGDGPGAASVRTPLAHPSRRSPSRVGVCRPPAAPAAPAAPPAAPARRPVGPGRHTKAKSTGNASWTRVRMGPFRRGCAADVAAGGQSVRFRARSAA